MHPRKITFVLFTIFLFCSLMFVTALATNMGESSQFGARVEIVANNSESVSAAGANVSIHGTVKQDIWAAGANVDIDTVTGENVTAAGAQVDLKGRVDGLARIAGAEINIDAAIKESLNAAGALVTVSENTTIGPESVLAGALLEFKGRADESLELYGDEVVFTGQAKGSVLIEAQRVKITDQAQISGDLTIRSVEPADVAPEATITGQMTTETITAEEFNRRYDLEESPLAKLWNKVIIGVSSFFLGLFFLLCIRDTTEQMMLTIRERPWRSLLWGIAILFVLPLAAIIAMVIVLGLPLGLSILFTIPFLIFLGFTSALLGLSDWILTINNRPKNTQQRILFFILAILVYIVIRLIPLLGGVIIFIAMLFGLGAFFMSIGQKLGSRNVEKNHTAKPGL